MPPNDRKSGAVAWIAQWWRAAVSEVVSTALLVALGVWAALPAFSAGPEMELVRPPLAHVALAFGFVVVANVQAFGPASGAHMNPAVTLAAVLLRRLDVAVGALYLVAQCVGATLGFALLQGLAPAGAALAPTGCTLPAVGVSAVAATAVEVVLTGTLVLLCTALWAAEDSARPDPAAPIKLGLLVAGLIYAGGALTGASLNPARSLGPALLHAHWADHWVYWVGPLLGAALATLLHRFVLAPRPAASPAPTPEGLPLHDKPEA